MTAVCDLADDLRDAIVEYQVGTSIWRCMQNGSLMTKLIVCGTEGDLRAELWIDCESQNPPSEKTLDPTILCRTLVRRNPTFDRHRLISQQLNCLC